MKTLKIKSIKPGVKTKVYDLTVGDNHNFFITEKQVLTHNCDYLTPPAQAALRNDMEAYHMTVRYILTCNYNYKIIPALKSRCHEMHISKTDITEFTARAATVLVTENIDFDLDILDTYVRATYPDLRKCLNQLQVNCNNGRLEPLNTEGSSEDELLIKAVDEFKKGNIREGRQVLMEYISLYPSRVEDIYKWMYHNLDLWGNTNEKKDAAIIHIRNGLANLPLVGIPEIALSATLIELTS